MSRQNQHPQSLTEAELITTLEALKAYYAEKQKSVNLELKPDTIVTERHLYLATPVTAGETAASGEALR